MEKHIYFVRHGQSESNVDGIYRGKKAQLTEMGHEQARIVAERIERIGVEAVISSTFPRAHDTALAIGERVGLPVETFELFGEWAEPTNVMNLHIEHPVRKESRRVISETHDHDFRLHDEETFSELQVRAEKAMTALLAHRASRICVVTHGGFLRALIGHLAFGSNFTKKLFVDFMDHFYTTNVGITYVRFDDEKSRWKLVTWNDLSHLG